jgi:serine acetyltransferase
MLDSGRLPLPHRQCRSVIRHPARRGGAIHHNEHPSGHRCGVDPGAQIGPRLSLAHTHGIVVGEGVRAGARLRLYSGVVLG